MATATTRRRSGHARVIRQWLLDGRELQADDVAAELGCSRSTLGYTVKAMRDQGYRIAQRADGMKLHYTLKSAPRELPEPAPATEPDRGRLDDAVEPHAMAVEAPPLGEKLTVWMVMLTETQGLKVGLTNGDTRWIALLEGAAPA